MDTENLVSAKEAAKVLGMGVGSLYRLARKRLIPSYKAGPSLSGVRFSIGELKAALRRPAREECSNER